MLEKKQWTTAEPCLTALSDEVLWCHMAGKRRFKRGTGPVRTGLELNLAAHSPVQCWLILHHLKTSHTFVALWSAVTLYGWEKALSSAARNLTEPSLSETQFPSLVLKMTLCWKDKDCNSVPFLSLRSWFGHLKKPTTFKNKRSTSFEIIALLRSSGAKQTYIAELVNTIVVGISPRS